jgi:ABC-type uncharacterized transport system ATPase subunit
MPEERGLYPSMQVLDMLEYVARLAGTVYERAILRTGRRLKVRQVLRSAA